MKARSGALHHSWLDTCIIIVFFCLLAAAFYIPVTESKSVTTHSGIVINTFDAAVYGGIKVDFVTVRLANGMVGTVRGFAEADQLVCVEVSDGTFSGLTRFTAVHPIEDCLFDLAGG